MNDHTWRGNGGRVKSSLQPSVPFTGGNPPKTKKKCNARCTFTRAAHPGMPWKSIRDTSAPSEPPEGASRSKLERCSLCFTLSFSCKEGKLRANLSANQWVECADYTRTDHHYLFIYFWWIQRSQSAMWKIESETSSCALPDPFT